MSIQALDFLGAKRECGGMRVCSARRHTPVFVLVHPLYLFKVVKLVRGRQKAPEIIENDPGFDQDMQGRQNRV